MYNREHDVELPLPPAKVKLSEFPMQSGNNRSGSHDEDDDANNITASSSSSNRKKSIVKKSTTNNTPSSSSSSMKPNDDGDEEGKDLDGMQIIMKLMSSAWAKQKKRCDAEIQLRLKQKNTHLATAAETFAAYKALLIRTLIQSKKAQVR